MKLFGREIGWPAPKDQRAIAKAFADPVQRNMILDAMKAKGLMPPEAGWTTIFDYNTGAWQQDSSIDLDTVLNYGPVFACIRLIASDIGKLRMRLMSMSDAGVWRETNSAIYSRVLRKPNSMQTRIKFFEQWIQSKLQFGNAYILKQRDPRGFVNGLRVLDPQRVVPLISDSGDVFYRLRTDRLAGVNEEVIAPAREIIHDVHMTPEHPLVGVSPIDACGRAATQGIKIQTNSQKLFTNMSRPSGILTAPGPISNTTASALKTAWAANYGGDNYGKVAVLGDDLKYQAISTTAVENQLVEQLDWTAFDVCRVFGVPPYKIGVGPMPAYDNINALDQKYYSETLQELIECIELLMDEGIGLPNRFKTEFDLRQLIRMDEKTRAEILGNEIKAGYKSPNEARAEVGLEPVEGGDTPYLQQQNYSLAALAKRDARDDPFATSSSSSQPSASSETPDGGEDVVEEQMAFRAALKTAIKELAA